VIHEPEIEAEDGRRARRDRNKVAVVDAYLALVREGNLHPSVAEVAERSGVSHRSVFRYFADKDDLARTAIEQQLAWNSTLGPLPVTAQTPLPERIEAFVTRRVEMFEAIGPVGRLSRSLALQQPIIADMLDLSRKFFRKQVKVLFQPELAAMDDTTAGETLAAIDVMSSYEAYDLLRRDQSMSQARAQRTMARAIRSLIT
jgi:TetR/AcrR family transcriptional regulator, regulator of autoinduction and epiphytic fitness